MSTSFARGDHELRTLAALVNQERDDLPKRGVPPSLLSDLKAQIPCDYVLFHGYDTRRNSHWFAQQVPEEDEDPDWDNAPLQGFLNWLEMAGGPPMLGICDVDGEYAFFRAADVAIVQIPLWALVPGLSEAGDESDELLFAEVTGPYI